MSSTPRRHRMPVSTATTSVAASDASSHAAAVTAPISGPSFADLGVPEDLIARLVRMDRPTPFAVQSLTLVDALAGRDLCVEAPTGSGKTLAFSIPLAVRARRGERGRPYGLILVPTRELAAQVAETLAPLAEARGRSTAVVYGGTNINRDLSTLRRGVDLLVATPGRLADLVQRGAADLTGVRLVVIDEADRMADMGFLPEVVRLLDRTHADRQTLLFSATLDGDVDALVRRYQHDPVRHTVAIDPADLTDVRHLFWPAERDARRRLTGDILRRVGPAIVFTRTKHGADRLVKQLRQDGLDVAAIHGDRSQAQRERALESFRSGEVQALVATDVAARGIHVDGVAAVVHYDLPGSDKDYRHRSGRTGRAGATGLVVALVDAAQHTELDAIQRSLDLASGLHSIDLAHLADGVEPPVTTPFATRRPGGDSAPRKNRARTNGRRGGTGRNAAPTSSSAGSGANNGAGASAGARTGSRSGAGSSVASNGARTRARRTR
jgi:superfamily II DNA/RNA helicase